MKALLSFLLIPSLASLSFSTRFAPVEISHNHAYDTTINEMNSGNGTSMGAGTCTYTLLIRTGTLRGAGTGSRISMKLAGPYREDPEIVIDNLVTWGGRMMGGGHTFFLLGNLDALRGTGVCLRGPICHMLLSSDGSGSGAAWYVEFVEVQTITGINLSAGTGCSFQRFEVNQWLALNAPPYQLHADRNKCNLAADDDQGENGSEGSVINLNSQA